MKKKVFIVIIILIILGGASAFGIMYNKNHTSGEPEKNDVAEMTDKIPDMKVYAGSNVIGTIDGYTSFKIIGKIMANAIITTIPIIANIVFLILIAFSC